MRLKLTAFEKALLIERKDPHQEATVWRLEMGRLLPSFHLYSSKFAKVFIGWSAETEINPFKVRSEF